MTLKALRHTNVCSYKEFFVTWDKGVSILIGIHCSVIVSSVLCFNKFFHVFVDVPGTSGLYTQLFEYLYIFSLSISHTLFFSYTVSLCLSIFLSLSFWLYIFLSPFLSLWLSPSLTFFLSLYLSLSLPLYPISVLSLSSVLCRIKMLPVVGHVHGLRKTLRVRAATANVASTLMKYTHSYII